MSTKTLPWLRLYTETVDDDKLALLAFEDRWHYIALLCLKGNGLLDAECSPELKVRRIAMKMGLSVTAFEEVIRRLSEVELVNKVTFQPCAWNKRQCKSDVDVTAAERKAAQRLREKELKKQQDGSEKDYVTGESRVTVTNVTATDLDLDLDLEKEEDKSLKTTPLPPAAAVAPKKKKSSAQDDPALQALCQEIWSAYTNAFFDKYGTNPVRNATVNAQVKQFAQRLGKEGVHVASWFLSHRDAWYLKGAHSFGLLLKDAEALRTQWATNRPMTGRQAREGERLGEGVATALDNMDMDQPWGAKS